MKKVINSLLPAMAMVICIHFANAQTYHLTFDGVDDYVDIGANAGNGIRSIELWFMPEVSYDNTLADAVAMVFRNDATESGEFGLYIGPSGWTGEEGRIVFNRKISGSKYFVASDSNFWNPGVCYHVAATIDPVSGMRLYIDGVLQSDADPSTGPTDARTEITAIGRWGDAATRNFNGAVEEVRFWNRALTQSEIQTKMNDTLNPSAETGLVGYWRLAEGAGIVANDLSGNGYNGTVNGPAWTIGSACMATGLTEIDDSAIRSLYPNPTNGPFFIRSSDMISSVQVFDMIGKAIYNKSNIRHQTHHIDLTAHPKGIYMVRVVSGDRIFSEKIIHQ